MSEFFLGIIDRKSAKQILHYGLFGVSRNLVGYSIYLLITFLGMPPKIAMSCLYCVGIVVGFFWNRKFIFVHAGSTSGAGFRFLVAHFFGYSINLAILIIMVDKLGYPHQWVQIGAIFAVAAFLFISFKLFVFPERNIFGREGTE